MGIIKKIKAMFSKNIDCSDVLEDKIFHLHTTKNRIITVGANVIVPEGYNAVFVCKNKVTDILPQGKYAIVGINMPKTFKKMHLAKADKRGNFPKKFVGDMYYICTKYVEMLKFDSYRPYKAKCREFGRVVAHSEGTFNIEISEPEKLLKYLLMDRAYITDDLFLELLAGIVGDFVNYTLQNSEYSFHDLVSNKQTVYDYLNAKLNESNPFENFGFRITNLKLEFMKVKPKLQQKVEQVLMEQKEFAVGTNQRLKTNIFEPEININKDEVISQVRINTNFEPSSNMGYRTCPKCLRKINHTARFCEHCGMDLTNF